MPATKKKSTKKPASTHVLPHHASRKKRLLILAAMSWIVICLALATLVKDAVTHPTSDPGVHVSLGMMQYSFNGMSATKRTDPSITELQTFLEHYGQKDIQLGCTSTYYNVMAYTKDESQILLNYGCDYPNARMFGVKTANGWQLISPTNHFDQFGVPECAYLSEHAISKEIAPVCVDAFEQLQTKPHYYAR